MDTARAFAQEIQSEKQSLCLDPNEEIPGIDIKDDEDANNRQSEFPCAQDNSGPVHLLTLIGIRRAILEGDIDKALKHTKASYPQVLEENEQVHFRLRCRKFIEMIRREAETNLVGAGGPKGNHATPNISGNNGHAQPPAVEDMELDEDMEDLDGAQGQRDLTQDALLYGQTLQAEYLGDERREVHTALNEIFGLMAYPNPLKEAKVAHLLDRKGRVAVAEELNSAILRESLLPHLFSIHPRVFRVTEGKGRKGGISEKKECSKLTVSSLQNLSASHPARHWKACTRKHQYSWMTWQRRAGRARSSRYRASSTRLIRPDMGSRGMMVTMKKLAAVLVAMTCIGCGPGPRRLSRSRSHLSQFYRRHILLSLTTIMMTMGSSWKLLDQRPTKGAALLVMVPDRRSTLPRLCLHPIQAEGAATALTCR